MIEQTLFKTIVIESLQYKREIGLYPEYKEKSEFIANDWRGGYGKLESGTIRKNMRNSD